MMAQTLAKPSAWRMPWNARWGISRTIAIAILTTASLAGLAALQWRAHTSTRDGFFDRFETRAAVASQFISSYVDDLLELEREYGRRYLTDSPTPDDVTRMANAFGFEAAVVVEDGRYVVGLPHDPSVVGKDLTSYDHIRSATHGRETVSNIISTVVRREPMVGLAVPLGLRDRNVVVSGGLPVDQSHFGRSYLKNITPIEGADVFLVDQNDQVIASNRTGVGRDLTQTSPALAEAIDSASSGTIGDGGTEAYFTAERVTGTPWSLVMMATTEDILSPIRATWAQWVLLAALTAAAGLTLTLVHRLQQSGSALHALNNDLEERVAERTSELAASNAELESFAYSVSHDLRAPLRAMDGFSKIVVDEYAAALPADAQRFLGMVRQNASKMQALIDDLLRYSRLGRHKLELHPIDMNAVVASVVHDLSPAISEHGTRVVVAGLPTAMGDGSLMWQVFSNLIGNAVKFSRDVDTPVVEVGARSHAGNVTYWVRDNGTGFDMAYADKLFGVFQRLHRSEDYEGSGVGLATVHRIVTRHGGRIWVESAPGRGATFYLEMKGTDDGERREDPSG